MPSKRKASPASNPESGSASRKSKRLAEVKQQPPVVQLADDSDFEAEPVTDKKKQSGKKEVKKADPSVAPVSASDDCEFEAEPVLSTTRKTENKKQSNMKGAKKADSPVAPVPASDDLVAETSDPAVDDDFVDEEDEIEQGTLMKNPTASSPSKRKPKRTEKVSDEECLMIGDPISDSEARQRWPHRYITGKSTTTKSSIGQDDSDELIQAKSHFSQAKVDGYIYNLEDCAHVQAESGNDDYICKIIEFFKGVDGADYFRAQWFYRAKDTVIKNHDQFIDKRRVFLSEMKDDNPLDCLLRKIKIVAVPPNASSQVKKEAVSDCDFFYDMMYFLPYSSFIKLPLDATTSSVSSSSTISSDTDGGEIKGLEVEKKLLDLYSGCGAMSTGLCLGANSNGVKLVTKWSVDFNKHACDSLRLNHPETQVRHEKACDFLSLLKEWVQLCASCSLLKSGNAPHPSLKVEDEVEESDDGGEESGDDQGDQIFEVEELLEVCYGDPNEIKKPGLYFKVRWQGYGEEEDTWEPIDGLSNCPKKIKEFVVKGFKNNLLPLPGDVDVVSGGPPCQGISGFNRFRNASNPLEDEKNGQLLVYMDIVEFLKPRFVLMENVVDLLKFANGHLGRFALSRLVGMNYQARAGMMAAGSYGLPQFRMRVFMWGALMSEKLPQYPLPTHKVIYRGVVPTEFDSNVVAYEKGQDADLKKELFLGDALSDLPPVKNDEGRDEMTYTVEPKTDFQRFIRLGRDGALGTVLYDHRPLQLNVDDYQRVCRIPKHKGANFRHLPGVRVRADNKVEWDPAVERVYLPSKKPLVPEYAMTFVGGSSSKPFARLWWDETVPTVVTRAEPHNQAITHPVQDRVLTIRENARLQGFPDYYKLTGPIKERYMQVGNAVAVPVARALGYSLALAMKGLSEEAPLLKLPEDFPLHIDQHNEVSQ